jgi:CRP-like cAMP-binding protein
MKKNQSLIFIRALTERIVLVLSRMKCSYAIEPHQIQGGDFIHIFPVVQWLVKRVFERRAEIGDFNRAYTLNQYEKQFNQTKDQPIISFKQNIEAIRVKFSTEKKNE